MLDNEPLGWWKLGNALFRLLDGRTPSSASVLMAVPLGFPIVEASYVIRERIPQEIGLIRRYVLDGVRRFGPCGSTELNDLLGLGVDVIEQTLDELSECEPGVLREHDKFIAHSETGRALTNGEFAKVVLQQRKFIINGLGDNLLPVDFWRHHEEWRLYPNPEHPAGSFLDAAGQATEIAAKIRDRMGCGQEDLQHWINSNDSVAKATLGIPEGSFGVISEPESVEVVWVASFLLMAADGAMSILSPHRQPASLLDPKLSRKDYLLQICEGLRPRDVDQHDFPAACESVGRSFGDFAEILPGDTPGKVLVRISSGRAGMGPPGGPDDGMARAAARLTTTLVRGRYWDYHTRFILQMLPADAATAELIAVQRALRELRTELRSRQQDKSKGDSFNVQAWWTRWQDQFVREIPKAAAIQPLSLDTLLRGADDMRDTEFAERLELLIRNHG